MKLILTSTLLLQIILTHTYPVQAESKTPTIGVILPLSGAFTRYGEKIRSAIEQEAGSDFKLIYEDEGCDPLKAVNAYNKLTNMDQIKYFIGPWCGSPQTALAPMIGRKNQLAVLGSSAPSSVFQSSNGQIFSSQHSIEDEAKFMAEKVNGFGVTKIVTVFKENQFSRTHEKAFKENFNGQVLETFAYTTDDISELRSIALRIKKLQPDALYVPDAFPLLSGFVKELTNIAVSLPIYSVYTAQSEEVLNAIGKEGKNLVYTYPDIQVEALDYFPTKATQLLVSAIKKCGEDTACAKEFIVKNNKLNSDGVLEGGVVLKTIRNGKFVKLNNLSY